MIMVDSELSQCCGEYSESFPEEFHLRPDSMSNIQYLATCATKRQVTKTPSATQKHSLDELEELCIKIGKNKSNTEASISLEEMVGIIMKYGPEKGQTSAVNPPRKPAESAPADAHKRYRAAVQRRFRRYNPHFHIFFKRVEGKWVPKLGDEEEILRREINRKEFKKEVGCKKARTRKSGKLKTNT